MPRPRARMTTTGGDSAPPFVAYYRVSTDKQGLSGLGLGAQKATVATQAAATRGTIVAEYEEVESGSRNNRPQLALALAECRARRAILIIAKVDRLARNAKFLLTIVEGAGEGGVVFCDLPQLPPGAVGKFVLGMFALVAELERGLISQRTIAALAIVKAKGTWISKAGNLCTGLGGRNLRSGFDTPTSKAGRAARTVHSKAHGADVLPFIADARRAGADSLSKVAAALTARGIQPPSGGQQWFASQVWRIERAGRAAVH
jgi:DNA invertase Pin-like site-specific DNA recombinase